MLMVRPARHGQVDARRAIPGILPPLTPTESLETTEICSALGVTADGVALTRPAAGAHAAPFGDGMPALIGGGLRAEAG